MVLVETTQAGRWMHTNSKATNSFVLSRTNPMQLKRDPGKRIGKENVTAALACDVISYTSTCSCVLDERVFDLERVLEDRDLDLDLDRRDRLRLLPDFLDRESDLSSISS